MHLTRIVHPCNYGVKRLKLQCGWLPSIFSVLRSKCSYLYKDPDALTLHRLNDTNVLVGAITYACSRLNVDVYETMPVMKHSSKYQKTTARSSGQAHYLKKILDSIRGPWGNMRGMARLQRYLGRHGAWLWFTARQEGWSQ